MIANEQKTIAGRSRDRWMQGVILCSVLIAVAAWTFKMGVESRHAGTKPKPVAASGWTPERAHSMELKKARALVYSSAATPLQKRKARQVLWFEFKRCAEFLNQLADDDPMARPDIEAWFRDLHKFTQAEAKKR